MTPTGPKSPEGKAIVPQNAVKHGLTAQRVVIPGEDLEESEALRRELLADLAPVGALEALCADRIITSAWRLRRAVWVGADEEWNGP